MELTKQTLTRHDWDKRFTAWSALVATAAMVGSIAFNYYALWAGFALLLPLYILLRFSTPIDGYHSPRISRWSMLVIPILFLVLPVFLILTRYLLTDTLR